MIGFLVVLGLLVVTLCVIGWMCTPDVDAELLEAYIEEVDRQNTRRAR